MVALPTLIPLSEAARKYGLEEAYLRSLVEKGKIRAGIFPGSDEVLVSEEEVRKRAEQEQGSGMKKEDLPEYQKHAHLQGIGIGIAEAARKYDIPTTTLFQWVQRGLISRIGREGQKVLLNEQDVAYCWEIYQKVGAKGRRIFNKNGTPYEPKTKKRIAQFL
jgi:transposase-like protein